MRRTCVPAHREYVSVVDINISGVPLSNEGKLSLTPEREGEEGPGEEVDVETAYAKIEKNQPSQRRRRATVMRSDGPLDQAACVGKKKR